ncbi:MAG: transketolase [Candidatus Zambryskibacteria bacterium]|nr:transketolase [Candidatus Zambryskibacteria bacterium]
MFQLDDEKIKRLEEKAKDIRISIVEMLIEASSGHPAGSLGMADIFAAFYFHILRHDPTKPDWQDRDRLILSNGHICPVLYASLAHSGYFPIEELKTLRKFGSRLQGHPDKNFLPIVEISSGPLGLGLSQVIGMTLADKINNNNSSKKYFYCFLSDGELQEGNIWEAAMLGGKEKLENLIAVIDRNNIQTVGKVENVMPLEPLEDKWRAFNWNVQTIDGHNFKEIIEAVESTQKSNKPSIIIAKTIPGKGISFMENDYRWHSRPVSKEEGEKALIELKKDNA